MEQKTRPASEQVEEKLVRIMSTDVRGNMKVYPGLTRIKGISWAVSNAICHLLKIDKTRKVITLTEDEIKKITEFIKNPLLPEYLMNRRFDFNTGESKHLVKSDLDLKKDFDIKRLKTVKSYRGSRHASNLPSRGQRTKAHFRINRKKGAGINKKGPKK